MSFSIQPKTLKKLVDYYYPHNHSEQMKYMLYLKGEDQLYMNLETSPFQGISENSIEERTHWFGKNQYQLQQATKFSFKQILGRCMKYSCLPLLALFAGISVLLSYFNNFNNLPYPHLQGVFSLVLTAINFLIVCYVEFEKYLNNQYLNDLKKEQIFCEVWRDGKKEEIKSKQIVVGDIVQLSIGSIVPADGWIFQGELTVQQKHATGCIKTKKATIKTCIQNLSRGQGNKTKKVTTRRNSSNRSSFQLNPQNYQQYSPLILSGSSVLEGQAKMIVLCVGKLSKQGQNVELIKINIQKTSILQKKIQQFTQEIFKYTMLLIVFLFILMIIKHIVVQIFFGNLLKISLSQLSYFLYLFSVPIICIPQAIVLGLGFGMLYHRKKLFWQKQIKIKRSIDTQQMAYVQYICHQKKEKKSYFKIKQWWNRQKIQIQNDDINQDNPQQNEEQLFENVQDLNQKFQDLFRKSISITTHIKKSKSQFQRSQKQIKYGSFKNLDECFVNYTKRKSYIKADNIMEGQIIQEIPYDNIRKRTTVIASFFDFQQQQNSHNILRIQQQKSEKKQSSSKIQNSNYLEHEKMTSLKKFPSNNNQNFLIPPSISSINVNSRKNSCSSNFSQYNKKSNKNNQTNEKVIIYIRGRHQTILDLCTHIMDKRTGQIQQIQPQDEIQMRNVLESMMNRQLRAVLLAFKITQKTQNYDDPYGEQQKGYVLLAILGINDMRSTEQFEQLTKLKQLSINVMIASSSSTQNSISAANQTGIIKGDDSSIIITGKQFLTVIGGVICANCKKNICVCNQIIVPKIKNSDQFQKILKHLDVLSECQQFHKFALITGLKNNNICNSITARQESDIPAMLQSDLSLYVDQYNNVNQNAQKDQKQIIRKICQVQLPNTSILTVFQLIRYSRMTHKFIRNYAQLMITSSIVGAIMFALSLLLFKSDFCFKSIQMLWLQLIFIGIALAFAFEDKYLSDRQDNIMSEPFKNYHRDLPLLNKQAQKSIMFHIFLQLVILLIVMFLGQLFIPQNVDQIDMIIGSDWNAKYSTIGKNTICSGLPYLALTETPIYQKTFQNYGIFSRHQTFMFNLFVLMQILNYFNCRKLKKSLINVFHNLKVVSMLIVLSILILHYLFIQNIGDVAGLYPNGLTFTQWILCLALAMLTWVFDIIFQLIPNAEVQQNNSGKVWPNKSYNIAVRAVAEGKTSLPQFQIQQDYSLNNVYNIQTKVE